MKLILIYVQNNSPQTFSIDFIIYWICLCGSGLRNLLTLHLNPSRIHTLQSLLQALSPRVFLPDVLKGSLFRMQAALRWCYQISHCCVMSLLFILLLCTLQHEYKTPGKRLCECWLTLNWSLQHYSNSHRVWARALLNANPLAFASYAKSKQTSGKKQNVTSDLYSSIISCSFWHQSFAE